MSIIIIDGVLAFHISIFFSEFVGDQWFTPGIVVSSTSKTEILLKRCEAPIILTIIFEITGASESRLDRNVTLIGP